MPFRLSDWPRKPAIRRSPAERIARLERDSRAKLADKLTADARRRKAALSSFQDHDILDLPAVDPKKDY